MPQDAPKMKLENVNREEAADKYRQMHALISAVSRLPKHIKECKLSTPPIIPKEFRNSKIPSNMFFGCYTFSIQELADELKEYQQLIGEHLPRDVRSEIDKST